jgi:hypothetical protein
MVGHNWGAEHAETWTWIHGGDLSGRGTGDYFDLAAGRVRIGPVLSPWVANGRLVLAGETFRVGGLGTIRSTSIDAGPSRCDFTVTGDGIRVRGTVGAPAERFVGWLYSNPGGGEHHALNCSISDLRLDVERPGVQNVRLEVAEAAVYEFGTEPSGELGVQFEPFADG